MRWLFTAFVWTVVIGVGFYGSKYYRQWLSNYRAEIVKDHAGAWDAAIGGQADALGTAAPPNTNEAVEHALLGQQVALRRQLSQVDLGKLRDYYKKLWKTTLNDVAKIPRPDPDPLVANVVPEAQGDARQVIKEIDKHNQEEYAASLDVLFRREWGKAYEEFDDTPVPARVAAAHVLNKKVLEESPELINRLVQADEQLTKRHPRVKLALDTFSGYCLLRSPEFRKNLLAKRDGAVVLHLVDDDAKYKKRIHTLESGETPLAVFTLDALINNSGDFDAPPASVVLLLDETHGADAILAYSEAFPTPEAMNRPDLKIIGVGDSPSETLARVVRTKLNLDKVSNDCFVRAESPEEVVKQFGAADPKDPKVFVLWEPYVSQVLRKFPKAHRLADSSRFSGYIVDVLVVQKKYLAEHRDEVEAVVEAYQETLPTQRTTRDMVQLVREDSKRLAAKGKGEPLTEEDARKIAEGIWWKTARENYGHFGLIKDDPPGTYESLGDMIKNSKAVLIQADALSKTKALSRSMAPEQFVDKEVCARLQQKEDFKPRDRSWVRTGGDVWPKLRPLSRPDIEQPISFSRGESDVPEDAEPVLRRLAELMKGHPDYYLEIQGHHAKDTEADEKLALDRAKEVRRWLQEQGDVPAHRLRAVALDAVDSARTDSGAPKSIVTVAIFQAPQ